MKWSNIYMPFKCFSSVIYLVKYKCHVITLIYLINVPQTYRKDGQNVAAVRCLLKAGRLLIWSVLFAEIYTKIGAKFGRVFISVRWRHRKMTTKKSDRWRHYTSGHSKDGAFLFISLNMSDLSDFTVDNVLETTKHMH